MADFLTSFAAAEARPYVERFHADLCAELAILTGSPVDGVLCAGTESGPRGSTPASDAAVLVALCSPEYYADAGCGLNWAVFERRFDRRPERRRAAGVIRVLVQWAPVRNPPPGLPGPPALEAGPLAPYFERGLRDVMRRSLGTEPQLYHDAVRQLARAVRDGIREALPALLADDRIGVTPAFPRPVARPGHRPPDSLPNPRRPTAHPDPAPSLVPLPSPATPTDHAGTPDRPGTETAPTDAPTTPNRSAAEATHSVPLPSPTIPPGHAPTGTGPRTTTGRPATEPTRTVPHVLYVGASPDDHARLRVDRGLREVLAIAEWGGIVVEPVPAATASDLRRILATRPDIVHLACHGVGDRLLFEDIHGEEHAVSARQIVSTLRLYQEDAGIWLRGLVLASCDSAVVVELFRGTADTVVAHTGPLDDLCANAFAGLFYREVARRVDLAAAARLAARHTVLANESCAALETGLVVLS
jgi:hypothetical protein